MCLKRALRIFEKIVPMENILNKNCLFFNVSFHLEFLNQFYFIPNIKLLDNNNSTY